MNRNVLPLVLILLIAVAWGSFYLGGRFTNAASVSNASSTTATTTKEANVDPGLNSLGVSTSTVDGLSYQISLPSSFIKSTSTSRDGKAQEDVWTDGATNSREIITVEVLREVQSKTDLIKAEEKEFTWSSGSIHGDAGKWRILKEKPFDYVSRFSDDKNTFVALYQTYGEGTVGSIAYKLYFVPHILPGKVMVVSYYIEEGLDMSSAEYLRKQAFFFDTLDTFFLNQ